MALETEFWEILEEMAARDSLSLTSLVAGFDAARGRRSLASTCRLAALEFAKLR